MKRWMDCGGDDGMLRPSDTLATRMTRSEVETRQPHPLVSQYSSCCTATTMNRASLFWSRVAIFLRNSVISKWSCGAVARGVASGEICCEDYRLNQYLACLSAQSDRGLASTLGDFTTMACSKSRTSSQYSEMASVSLCAASFPSSVLLVISSYSYGLYSYYLTDS